MAGVSIPVGIKNAQFKAGLDEMRGQARKFAGEFSSAFTGIAPAILAAFSFNRAKEQAEEISQMSRRFRMSAEDIQKFGAAAKKVGVDMEGAARGGFKAFIEGERALGGDKSSFEKFERLGITLDQLSKVKGPADMIWLLNEAVNAATNKHEAMGAAVDLVGMKQANLANMFAMSREEMEKITSEAPIMSDATVEAFHKMEAATNRFKKQATAIAGEVLPPVVRILESLIETWKGAVGIFASGLLAKDSKQHMDNLNHFGDEWSKRMDEIWNGKDEAKPVDGNSAVHDFEADDSAKAAKKEADAAEKLAERKKKLEEEIAKMREDAALAAMDHEERLLALQEKRRELLLAGGDGVNSTESELQARKETLEVEKQIAEETKKASDAKDKATEAEDKVREQYDKELEHSQDEEAAQAEKRKLAGMTPAQKRQYLQGQSDDQWSAADIYERNGMTKEASQARVKAGNLQDEIDGIKDPAADSPVKKGIASVAVDSLRAVGGGGGIGSGGTSPELRESQNQTKLLEQLVRLAETGNSYKPASRAPLK